MILENIKNRKEKNYAATRDRTRDLQIFSLTLSQLSYRGLAGLGDSVGVFWGINVTTDISPTGECLVT